MVPLPLNSANVWSGSGFWGSAVAASGLKIMIADMLMVRPMSTFV